MKGLETGSSLILISQDHLRLDRLTQLQLVPLLQYLYVLIQSAYVTVSLNDLFLVFPDLMLQFLYFSSLMIN